MLERKAHKPEDVIRPVTMEEKISRADSPAHLQADGCQCAEQYRQSGLGRGLLHLARKEQQQQKRTRYCMSASAPPRRSRHNESTVCIKKELTTGINAVFVPPL